MTDGAIILNLMCGCRPLTKWVLDPNFYTTRERDYSEILPWDHIDIGVTKDFFIRENEKAKQAKTTPNCREKCAGCGIASFKAGVCTEKRAEV